MKASTCPQLSRSGVPAEEISATLVEVRRLARDDFLIDVEAVAVLNVREI